MRSSIQVALLAALAFSVATQASALSSMNLVYLDGATGPGESSCTTPDLVNPVTCQISAAEGDVVRFALTISVDTAGFSAYSYDLRWDTANDDQMNLDNRRIRPSLDFVSMDPGPPPSTVTIGYQPDQGGCLINPSSQNCLDSVQESDLSQQGFINKWIAIGKSPQPPYIASVSFRIGVVAFEVNPGATEVDIDLGFFTGFAGGNTFLSAENTNVTPNFATAAVTVPEPGTSLLIASSLGSLVLLALWSKRDN